MKIFIVIGGMLFFVICFTRCNNVNSRELANMKDLDQNMLDLMMYHDNLGIYLRKGEADYSSWLLEGMDSCLKVIAGKFEVHRKLTDPFEKDYKKRLLPSIKNIRQAVKDSNMPAAISAYRTLTNKCNGCHIVHEVDKEVMDLSDPSYY